MTPCETCRGSGSYGRNVPGFEGVPERDDEVICSDCGGLGYVEAFEMLTCIIAIRDSDRLVVGYGTSIRGPTGATKFVLEAASASAFRAAAVVAGTYGTVVRNLEGTFTGTSGNPPAGPADIQLLRDYHANPTPTAAESVASIKASIRLLRVLAT